MPCRGCRDDYARHREPLTHTRLILPEGTNPSRGKITCKGTRTPNLRIQGSSGASSTGFMRVRAAAQVARMYSRELPGTGVNCNPNCNPADP